MRCRQCEGTNLTLISNRTLLIGTTRGHLLSFGCAACAEVDLYDLVDCMGESCGLCAAGETLGDKKSDG